jgi:DNA-binding CsgD family transcriptional regulator
VTQAKKPPGNPGRFSSHTLDAFLSDGEFLQAAFKQAHCEVRAAYERISVGSKSPVHRDNASSAAVNIGQIIECVHAAQVDSIVRTVLRPLAADQYYFVAVQLDWHCPSPRVRSYHYLWGAAPGWARSYVDQRHFVSDPVISLARDRSEPFVEPDLRRLEAQSREMLHTASEWGFQNWMVTPTHCHTAEWFGFLNIASSKTGAEVSFQANRVALKMLAGELLAWRLKRLAHDFSRKYPELRSRHLTILRSRMLGKTTREIAQEQGYTVETIRQYARESISLLDAQGMDNAVEIARANGLSP